MQWWWYWTHYVNGVELFRSGYMILHCKDDLQSLLILGRHQSRQLLLILMDMMSISVQEQGTLLPLTWEQVLLFVIFCLHTELKTWSHLLSLECYVSFSFFFCNLLSMVWIEMRLLFHCSYICSGWLICLLSQLTNTMQLRCSIATKPILNYKSSDTYCGQAGNVLLFVKLFFRW